MKKAKNIRVGISVGDLNGIGPEIIFKTFEDDRMLEFCTPVVFASTSLINYLRKQLKYNLVINGVNHLDEIQPNKFNVINCWKEQVEINPGKEDTKIGEYAIKSLKEATAALKEGLIDALVTAPINKSNVQSKDFNFPGHTDYLSKELGGSSLMFMISNDLRVGLLTDHLPVKDVSSAITPDLITSKVKTVRDSLVQDFLIPKPKIAVLSINPHAGDNGVIGTEDDTILKPTLKNLREKDILVFGPYSADSFFGSGNYKEFDAIIASYHDQGLIPFKTLAFGRGVNFTAGLDKIRTSPDHGTAYEIAGKGEADENSFKEAVFAAIKIYRNRRQHKKYSENPLKKQSRKR